MNTPKPPFHTTTEELLYNILQKLPDVTYLTANDISSIAKLNALILDGDIPTDESITTAIDAIKGKVPEEGNTLGKLYSIIQGLGNLKSEDIDTLVELNAILTDADVVSTTDLSNAINTLLENVPPQANTLKRLFDLITTKQDKFADTVYPNTYFASPTVTDPSAGLRGDYTRPFSVERACQLAASGDTIAFLPGVYYLDGINLAKNGVMYTTFFGKAILSAASGSLFDYDSLEDTSDDVTIDGDFDFYVNGGTVFNFKEGVSLRKYTIRWSNAFHNAGTFMRMPVTLSTGIFEGSIQIDKSCPTVAIECRSTARIYGAGVMNLQIVNNSEFNYAILPWFAGFVFNISYIGTNYGLFTAPINAGAEGNVFTLNIKQGAGCKTFLCSGEYTASVEGGEINLYGDKINLNARLMNCKLYGNPQSSSKVTAQATNVAIVNDQVTVLKLDGIWKDCSYTRTSTSLCIMEGRFYNLQCNSSVSALKITGYVRLADGTSLIVNGNEYLEITGTLVGNAAQLITLSQTAPIIISGSIKQLNQLAPAIKSANGGYTHSLTLKGAVIEAGASAPGSIQVDLPDGLNLKLYGKSYGNKAIGGTAAVIYQVGANDDFVTDADMNVINV